MKRLLMGAAPAGLCLSGLLLLVASCVAMLGGWPMETGRTLLVFGVIGVVGGVAVGEYIDRRFRP